MPTLEPAVIANAPLGVSPQPAHQPSSSDEALLVKRCLEGDEDAWAQLLQKYRRLIYSIPIKYSLSADQAADIFQEVCVELVAELPRLREPRALPKWLIQVTAHKCGRVVGRPVAESLDRPGANDQKFARLSDGSLGTDDVLLQVEREQRLRNALEDIPARCRSLIEMLFYEKPPRPYREVAESLSIASGSIGFIRGRCLARLRKILESQGVS